VPGAGTYAVDLHLAEIYFTTTGSRIFNINIENGQFVRNNLDLIQTIGSINQAYVLRADNLNVTDGTLNISVTNVVNNAKLSGISVLRYTSGTSSARTYVLDGETKDSPQVEKDETASFMVYPNPAAAGISILLRADKRSQWSLGLTDVTGRKFSLGLIELEEGIHEIPIDLQSLNFPNGIFVLSADSAGIHFHTKIIVVR
jgi:hypothetical protein